ncbi:MAG: glycosyltransferase family 39 protein [Flavobacteriales bacterium]
MKFLSFFSSSSPSKLALVFAILFIVIFRMTNVSDKETSWDVLGYYLPLPATFIYEDPLMENRDWIEKINKEKDLTGTLYQISSNDEGEPIYFFLLGMAILYLPFFLIGHGGAYLFDYPPDGFSLPYQYAMVLGAIFYTIIGLVYLRKILLRFIPEKASAIVIILIVFATNYSHHLTLKNLETVNVLFMFVALIIWNTIRWHESHKLKNLIVIGSFITLMSMVKPSEIMVVFIPLFWGVYSWDTFVEKLRLIIKYRTQFLISIFVCLIIASPQMSYWWIRTGHLFYDSYKNPGVGLDFTSPYLLESLFSYKKGWLVYTPLMILSLVGFFFMLKKFKEARFSFLIYFLISFYIIISWTEWWYGAGFSNRPLITVYPILALGLGFFFMEIKKSSKLLKISIGSFAVLCLFLNQFQWWQLRNGILEPYRTTKEYYWASFLKTSVTDEDRSKLEIYRDFDGEHEFVDQENYNLVHETIYNFDQNEEGGFQFTPEIDYSKTFEVPFNEISQKDHLWITVRVFYKGLASDSTSYPILVTSIQREEGEYGYYARQLQVNNVFFSTQEFNLDYLTPNMRNLEDRIKVYIWNKNKINFEIERIIIKAFERK